MNRNVKLVFTLLLFSTSTTLLSQEICDNGIDDDGDGRIDCYDGECSSDGACDDFFFGNVVECADDIDVNTFAIRLQWASEDQSSNSHATPMVGDLDGNGIPEVIATNKQRRSLFILNGATGATLFSNTSLSFQPENVPVIGDIDRDEFGEILVSQDQGDDMALLDHEANIIWTAKSSRNDAIGLPGFADFDEDGDVEIYYRNEVVDAATGNVLIAGTNSDWERDFTHGSLAVDVLADSECADCAGLELISGNEIWSINEAAGTRTLIKDLDSVIHNLIDPTLNYYPKYYSNWDDQWSTVSAADYNLDGSMDLIITGALGTAAETFQGETTIFFWDVENDNVLTFHDPSNNFVRGPGRVNIGDVDGDGQLNANFVMNQKLYSLDENFNIHWIRPIKEGSSGFTGCSLFDFDGDGATEVVYRSEESLLIVDGIGNGDNTTNIRNEIACVSRTQEEYPVIADVDGDGASEICLACYSNNSTPFSPYSNTRFSQVRIYESDGEAWMPARGVWNQHAYYNVNVNDDLTIPTEVQDHTVVFSPAGTCEYSDGSLVPFDSRPLNSFLNQAPILNEDGCVEFASPDIEFVGILNATDAACPDATIDVTFEIRNIGDIAISGNLPVSYYAGDPRNATGSTLLDTEVSTLVNFEPETTIPLTQTITGVGGEFELFVVINDNGSTPPITVPLPTATIPECDTENNIQSTNVGFTRFDLISEKLNDNRKCDDALPDNGSAQAYYFGVVPGENGTFWVENFEDNDNSDQSDTGETAWTSDPGTQSPSFYGVANYNGSKMFNAVRTGGANDSGEVTWVSEAIDISNHTDITATLDLFENGNQESSGKWRDYIIATYEIQDQSQTVTSSGEFTNGRKFGNFDYAQAILTGVNNAGQNDSLLIITVTIHNTSTSEFHYLDNVSIQGTPVPVPTIQTEADGFTFNWYNIGDTSNVIHTGSTISQLAEGDYIVEGFFGPTLCFSALDTITIERTTPEVYVWSYEVSQETNCNTPDGSAFAFAYTQTANGTFPADTLGNDPLDTLLVADGYQVNWRINGDVTNTVIATGNLIENQPARDYAVDITEDFTGCFSTAITPITAGFANIAGVNTSNTDVTSCGGTAVVSANVGGNTADYTFTWYDTSIKPASDFVGPDYTVSNIGADSARFIVIASDNITGCTSQPDTVYVRDLSNAPVLTASESVGNDNCGANPNGEAIAAVNGVVGDSGFDYTWFLGNNTLAANELPGSALITADFGVGEWEMTGLLDGVYTIIVEETATNCTDTTTVTISDISIDPTFITEDAVVTPNTSCGTPNGLIETGAAITPSISYAFSLYSGPTVNSADSITTNSSGSFPGLAPGTYTIAAVDNTSECETAVPLTVSVGDEPDYPIIVTSSTADEFCIDGNGTITVTSSSNVTEPGSYTYEIFEGFSFASEITAISNITVNNGATGHTFAGLEDGNYRIRVTNDNLTCDSFADVVVGDASVVPTFSASRLVNNNTSCDAANPNGAISISIDEVGFDATNYTWEWYQGSSADADFLLANPESGEGASVTIDGYAIADNALNNIAAGDYTVFARDNTTGCKTIDLTLTVSDVPYQPNVIVVQEEPQTDCDDGNGILRAYVDDPDLPCTECIESDGFSFQWQYLGADIPEGGSIANGSANITGTQSNTISGLIADEYSVIVIETNTQCPGSETFILGAAVVNPVVAFASKTPNTICDDASAAVEYTGSITVTSTFDGSDFTNDPNATYEWFDGDDTGDPVIVGETGPTLSNRQEGFYTVRVRNTDTNCPSNPITVEVLEAHDEPAVTFSGIIGNSVCDPTLADDSSNDYNGEITADVTGGSGTYAYQWFSALDGELVGETNATLSTVQHGSYTVEITDLLFGCVVSFSESIPDNRNDPTLLLADVVPSPVSVCTGGTVFPNGSVTVNEVDGITDFTNYSFEWFTGAGTGTPHPSGETGNTLSNVDVGEYTVRVVNDITGCTSATRTVEVEESLIDINAAEVIQQLTDCSTPNGSIQVTASMASGAEPASYSFEWFFGSGTSNPLDAADFTDPSGFGTSTSGTDQATASGLEDGTYTVRITNDDTQCDDTFEFDIEDNQIIPTLTVGNIDVTDNTICDPALASSGAYNGIIDPTLAVTPTIASGVTYEFELFDAADVSQGTTTSTFTEVAPGNYTITARITDPVNGGVGCVSTAVAVVMGNDLTLPDFDLTGNPDVFCNAENGSIDIDFAGGIPADGFEIEIFTDAGATASQQVIGAAVNTFPVSSNTDLASQTYYVRFINNTTGCSAIEPIFVDEVLDQPTVDSAVPTDDNFCNGANGTITVTGSNIGTDPLYSLYSGPVAVGTPTTQASNVFTGLATGTYTVTITKNDAGESGCESDGVTVFVDETLDIVTASLIVQNAQTSCDGDSPNGSLQAGVASTFTTLTPVYTFYQGSTTNAAAEVTVAIPTASVTANQADGLPAGLYTVRVENTTTGCFDTEQIVIDSDPTFPQITGAAESSPNNTCTAPFTGAITVSADENGSTEPLDGANGYTFELYLGNSIDIGETAFATINENDGDAVFTALEDGDYMVRVIDNNTSCEVETTVAVTVSYSGPVIDPAADLSPGITQPSNCFTRSGTIDLDGLISITGGDGTETITVTWYEGFDIGGTAIEITDSENLGAPDEGDGVTGYVAGAAPTPLGGTGGTLLNYRLQDVPAINFAALLTLDNGCTDTLFINIPEVGAPDVAGTITQQPTLCSSPTNGTFEFDITAQAGDLATNYEYTLFSGVENVDPDADNLGATYDPPVGDGDIIARTAIPDLNGTTLTENVVVSSTLDPGTYTLIVIRANNPADECPVFSQTFTMNNPDRPDLSTPPTVVDNTNCADDGDGGIEYNGSITVLATYGGASDDFTFNWYTVNETTDTYTLINNGATSVNADDEADVTITLNALGNGNNDNSRIEGIGALTGGLRYAVVATHAATSCADTLHMDLFNDPTPIIISGTPTDITVCTPGAMGGFTVNSFNPGVVGNYTFVWLDNDGVTEVVDDADKLDYTTAGDYYVIATNTTNGCSERLDFTITNTTEDPIITLNGGITNNTRCADGPLGLTPNGGIDTQIPNDDGGTYVYRWYLGDAASVGTTAMRLEDGADPGNGSSPAGAGTIALDDGTLSISGLAAGTYALEVLDTDGQSLDCSTVEDFVVEDDLADITIDAVATTPQVFCNPDENGTATIANVLLDGALTDATTANIEFRWYSDNVAVPPLQGTLLAVGTQGGANNSQVTDLPAGTYYVDAYNEDSDCVSDLVEFTIENEEAFPAVQLTELRRDSICTTSDGSGSILASVSLGGNPPSTDAASEYTFEWYQGAGNAGNTNFQLATPGTDGASVVADNYTITADGDQVDNLPAGTYEVVVTNNAGGTAGDNCSTTAAITITQFTPVISIADADITVTPNQNCSPSEAGSAEVTRVQVTSVDGGFYFIDSSDPEWLNLTFEWYDDATLGAIQDNDELYEGLGLDDETYYVIVSNWSTTGCSMASRKEVIVPDDIPPLTLTLVEDAPDNFCAPVTEGNGQVTLEISIDGAPVSIADATQYTIEWFEGSGTGTALGSTITSSILSNNNLTVSDIPNGTYTVRVTKDGVGAATPALSCVASAEITVDSDEEDITLEADVDYTRTPNTVCDPAVVGDYNGSITITAVTEGGTKIADTDPEFANFSFTWTLANGVVLPGTATVAGASLSTIQGAVYEVTVQNDERNCVSEIIQIEVEDNLSIPTIALTASTINTHCDGATSLTGSLEATVSGGTGPFTFDWVVGDVPGGTAVPAGDVTTASPVSTASNLDGGSYTVVATDAASGCTVTGTYFVDETLDIPTLDISTVQANALADSLCTGDSGTIIINDADISGADLTLFNISVTDGGGLDVTGSPFNATTATTITIENLTAGDYAIDAVNITTNCAIATGTVTIQNVEENPLVTLESLTPDQACPPGVVNAGEIVVLVDGAYDHTNPRYTFLWEVEGGGALPVAVADNEATLTGIPGGNYQVTVTNNNTGCFITRAYEVPNESLLPNITGVDVADNTNCTPDNGSFELLQVTYRDDIYEAGGANEIDGVFELIVFLSSDDSQQGLVSNVPYSLTGLSPDDYYAVVRHIASTCESEPYSFTIEDDPSLPIVALTLDRADSTCQAGFSPNATVTALANGESHLNVDYSFQWYFGAAADIGGSAVMLDGSPLANGSVPVGFNESTVSGLAAGLYTVQVSQASNGCIVTEEINIPNIPAEVAITDLDLAAATNCFGNGTIDVVGITKDDFADDPANYIIEFYTENPENTGAAPVFTVPTDGPVFDQALGATTYFVVATHAELGCVAPTVQTEVAENVDRPVVELNDFDFQTNCDPDNPNGRFLVLADGQPDNDDYDFQWFFGTTSTDSLSMDDYQGGQNLVGAGTNEVSGLAAGFYTVVALNNITGCTTAETFEMTNLTPDDLEITTTVSNNTSCDEPNGIVSASVIIGQNLEDEVGVRTYNYYWFIGTIGFWGNTPDSLQASFRGQTITGLPQGNYVVLAVDRSDSYCNSIARQVNVNDDPIISQYEIETRDVTVCFAEKDGYAEIVMDDLSQVDITWRNDMNDSIGAGFFIDSLDAGLYSVTVTNRITQCPNSRVFEIFNRAVTPNDPTVIVNNGRNNCSFANGSAIANVDGVTNNFLFEWFEDPLDEIPYATGFQVNNLDTITYYVRATDINTGCPSNLTPVTIDYEQVDPLFEVVVDNSICLRTEDGSTNQFTGSATIVFEEFNLPTEYEWTYLGDDNFQTEEVISRDARLIDAFPGNYRVRFVAENGCEYFANFSVDVTLNIYNGVSANDDGKNDFFLIDCIDYFPQNNVKIFNRAGQRIYEVNGYDNRNIRFEGVSNVGGGGLVLPSGTYFYLVDLGTGDDPIQGFLELVR